MSPPRRSRTPARSKVPNKTTARPSPRRKARPARDFWGPDEPDEQAPTVIRAADHPTALVQSLGAPPFPNGVIARHYFDAVYERAAALAIALATSAGLSEPDDPDSR
jgi:hypothetical protein